MIKLIDLAPEIRKKKKVTRKTSTTIKNFSLDGEKKLLAQKITTTIKIVQEYNADTDRLLKNVSKEVEKEQIENLKFDLREVTEEEIDEYRRKNLPSFILKKKGKLYYAKIPKNINVTSIESFGEYHKCACSGKECKRLLAIPDEKGGCAKVRNRARFIEKYSWIPEGYETFGTVSDVFFVAKCSHYKGIVFKPDEDDEY